jgi:hypothetical protein
MGQQERYLLIQSAATLATISQSPAEEWTEYQLAMHRSAFDIYVDTCILIGVRSKDTTREAAVHAIELSIMEWR